MKRLTINAALIAVLITSPSLVAEPVRAQVMTVDQLSSMIAEGKLGELAATSYVQGVMDGMIAFEAMRRNGLARPKEFCVIFDKYGSGFGGTRHPAYQTKSMVAAWQREGQPMDTIAPDMALSFLSNQYGCR